MPATQKPQRTPLAAQRAPTAKPSRRLRGNLPPAPPAGLPGPGPARPGPAACPPQTTFPAEPFAAATSALPRRRSRDGAELCHWSDLKRIAAVPVSFVGESQRLLGPLSRAERLSPGGGRWLGSLSLPCALR